MERFVTGLLGEARLPISQLVRIRNNSIVEGSRLSHTLLLQELRRRGMSLRVAIPRGEDSAVAVGADVVVRLVSEQFAVYRLDRSNRCEFHSIRFKIIGIAPGRVTPIPSFIGKSASVSGDKDEISPCSGDALEGRIKRNFHKGSVRVISN